MIKLSLMSPKDNNERFGIFDGEKLLGYCLFSLEQKEILDFFCEDKNQEGFIINNLCKAVLNYFALQSIQIVTCKNVQLKDFLLNLRFTQDETGFFVDLQNYFDCKCQANE